MVNPALKKVMAFRKRRQKRRNATAPFDVRSSLMEKISEGDVQFLACSYGLRWAAGYGRVYLRRLGYTERLSVDCHGIDTALHVWSEPNLVCTNTPTHVAITPRLRADKVVETRTLFR